MTRKDKKIILKKSKSIKKMAEKINDIQLLSERSLSEIWSNKKNEIWNQYLTDDKSSKERFVSSSTRKTIQRE